VSFDTHQIPKGGRVWKPVELRNVVLKDTPIDQYVFGVKAVDQAGHESPASAYLLPPPLRGATGD
jgi:hypothetical protein